MRVRLLFFLSFAFSIFFSHPPSKAAGYKEQLKTLLVCILNSKARPLFECLDEIGPFQSREGAEAVLQRLEREIQNHKDKTTVDFPLFWRLLAAVKNSCNYTHVARITELRDLFFQNIADETYDLSAIQVQINRAQTKFATTLESAAKNTDDLLITGVTAQHVPDDESTATSEEAMVAFSLQTRAEIGRAHV